MIHKILTGDTVESRDQITRLIGKTVGIITDKEALERYRDNPGHEGPLWGTLSLVSFQADGTMAALRHGSFVEVFAIVEVDTRNFVNVGYAMVETPR